MEDADDGFGDDQDVGGRKKLVEDLTGARQRCRPAGNGHPEAPLCGAVRAPPEAGVPADVVDGDADVIVGATLERDLELAGKGRTQRVPEQIPRQRLRVRCDVERLRRPATPA